jgi:hypothetical protein
MLDDMKTCSFHTCINPVFGTDKNTRKGYCKKHQYLRTDKKDKKTDRTGKRIMRTKRSPSKNTYTPRFPFESQPDLFAYLWRKAKTFHGEVYCKYTGEKLNDYFGTDLWLSCFAHILSKKNYPYFKLNPDNVEVVLPEFHRIIDQGTYHDRDKHPKWKWDDWDRKAGQLKAEYIIFKKENLLP